MVSDFKPASYKYFFDSSAMISMNKIRFNSNYMESIRTRKRRQLHKTLLLETLVLDFGYLTQLDLIKYSGIGSKKQTADLVNHGFRSYTRH